VSSYYISLAEFFCYTTEGQEWPRYEASRIKTRYCNNIFGLFLLLLTSHTLISSSGVKCYKEEANNILNNTWASYWTREVW